MGNSDQELAIVIRAVDEASEVLKEVKRTLGDNSDETRRYAKDARVAAAGSRDLHKEWQKLTSVSKYLEEGIQNLRRSLTTLLWSNVALAVSSVVMQMVAYVVHAGNAKISSEDLARSVADQAREWGLLPEKIKDVTQASIDLYNMQLLTTQWNERNKGKELEKDIQDLTKVNEELAKSFWILKARQIGKEVIDPLVRIEMEDLWGRILNTNLKLKKAKKEYEDWQKLQGREPATLSGVSSYVNKDKIDAANKAEQDMYAKRLGMIAQFMDSQKDLYTDEETFIERQLAARVAAYAASTNDQLQIAFYRAMQERQLHLEWQQIQDKRDRDAEVAAQKERQRVAKYFSLVAEGISLQK